MSKAEVRGSVRLADGETQTSTQNLSGKTLTTLLPSLPSRYSRKFRQDHSASRDLVTSNNDETSSDWQEPWGQNIGANNRSDPLQPWGQNIGALDGRQEWELDIMPFGAGTVGTGPRTDGRVDRPFEPSWAYGSGLSRPPGLQKPLPSTSLDVTIAGLSKAAQTNANSKNVMLPLRSVSLFAKSNPRDRQCVKWRLSPLKVDLQGWSAYTVKFYAANPRTLITRGLRQTSSLSSNSVEQSKKPAPIDGCVEKFRQYSFANGLQSYNPRAAMAAAAKIIDGIAIARNIRENIATNVRRFREDNPQFKPSLIIVQVGGRPDSSTYVRMKRKAAEEAGIICEILNYPDSITEPELLQEITGFNNDPAIHGILVQLPLPKHILEHAITSAVAEEKDVDGFGACNIGELSKRGGKPLFIPCTPQGVMALLKESGVELQGKNAVVLGRSNIVGIPVSALLRNADATVTVCHSRTQDLKDHVKRADVLVAAIGQAKFVKGDWLKPGVVVIDVGTNYIPDDTKKSGSRLVGDVDYESAVEVASKITPVPGGVGPMTVAMLLQNVVDSATRYFDKQKRDASSL
ncbi:tetrahydrofolate synthase [Pseudocyphellaria aurata]|nr:tetrahydrofolate synthase [Pseudocyphellaria aurata]